MSWYYVALAAVGTVFTLGGIVLICALIERVIRWTRKS